MRKKQKLKLVEEEFWRTFYYINIPKHINGIPAQVEHVRFRVYDHVDDGHLARTVEFVTSVGMLGLDETEITNAGIEVQRS